jgi:hypothetical protein
MSTQQPGSSFDDERPEDAGATREISRPQVGEPPAYEPSPWARPEGQTEPYGQPPPDYAPAYPPSYAVPPAPEPRFAGQPYAYNPAEYGPPGSPYGHNPTSLYGRPLTGGNEGPWQSPDPAYPQAPNRGWPTGPATPPPRSRRGRWALVTLLVIALVAGVTTAVGVSSDSKKQATPVLPIPLPTSPATPGPSSSASPSPSPSGSVPSQGLVPTPPALRAIGYHAYSLRLLAKDEVSLGPAEDVQFRRYGLSRIVGLRALTVGDSNRDDDDYDASINVLRFRDAAGAKAELAYSNTQNAKDSQTIALPGLPTATGFLNKGDATTGISVGAFTTVGRYQVVVILGGLTPNVPTKARVVAAEAARVMKAILPVAASTEPDQSGGTTPQLPTLPTPTPSGTRA